MARSTSSTSSISSTASSLGGRAPSDPDRLRPPELSNHADDNTPWHSGVTWVVIGGLGGGKPYGCLSYYMADALRIGVVLVKRVRQTNAEDPGVDFWPPPKRVRVWAGVYLVVLVVVER